jgi:hypothetical protein
MVWISMQGKPLKQPSTPMGIVSIELAYTVPKAQLVINSWQLTNVMAVARQNIYIDFLFIISYCTTLILAVLASTKPQNLAVKKAGKAFIIAILIAGTCDIFENGWLLQLLAGNITPLPVAAAAIFATIKFSLIVITLLFLLYRLMHSQLIKKAK